MAHEHHHHLTPRQRAIHCALEIAKLALIGATTVATIHVAQDVHHAKRRLESLRH